MGLDMVGMFSLAVPAAVESWISSAMVAEYCWKRAACCWVYCLNLESVVYIGWPRPGIKGTHDVEGHDLEGWHDPVSGKYLVGVVHEG